MANAEVRSVSETVAQELPYLRRYARALTGSQTSGDSYAVATIEAILADPTVMEISPEPKVALYKAFHLVWTSASAETAEPDSGLAAAAQRHLSRLTPNSREALLLHTIEEFSLAQVGAILDISESEAGDLVDLALREMENSILGRVMVIEDEAIIAMDISAIVETLGHKVTGVARTHREALALAEKSPPDLILADIQLADNSSGIEAVNEILPKVNVPVIFITAFPERLLTGERPEPAFLINKPYTEEQLRSAISQAMFFSSTETLQA